MQALAVHDERALLDRLWKGDESAFEELVRETMPRMLAVARRYFPAEHDANDAVQDAYLSAFKALPRFSGDSKLSTWLHRIVVNACLMKLRSQRRRPERSIEDLLPRFRPDGHAEVPAREWNPGGGLGIEEREELAMVRASIEELPEAYREVLVLRDVEGLDTGQAALWLGITENAVKTRLHRARQALRELLDRKFEGSVGG